MELIFRQSKLVQFLLTKDAGYLQSTFTRPTTCLGIFQLCLSYVAKHIVLRFLYLPESEYVSVNDMRQWFNSGGEKKFEHALELLVSLYILESRDSVEEYKLTTSFKRHLHQALAGTGVAPEEKRAIASPVSQNNVQSMSDRSWELVLNYMMGSNWEGIESDGTVEANLKESGLMSIRTDLDQEAVLYMTPLGFQFLLQDRQTQLWFYILSYVREVELLGEHSESVLHLIFSFALAKPGSYLKIESSKFMKKVTKHMARIGLCVRVKEDKVVYPSHLAIALLNSNALAGDSKDKGCLIVETNFRVYAYTRSDLVISLLQLFSTLMYRLPTMSVAMITRDSVRAALSQGITSRQILHFLKVHCSDRMILQEHSVYSPLPTTVSDQIILWEQETDRFKKKEGVLFRNMDPKKYAQVVEFAIKEKVCIWKDPSRHAFITTIQGKRLIKQYYASLSSKK
eukprot:m.16186 g.16186  ORF g.16186 m.16186 type:complete len:455 (+) comp4578_c0_seq1:68-1432(+)